MTKLLMRLTPSGRRRLARLRPAAPIPHPPYHPGWRHVTGK